MTFNNKKYGTLLAVALPGVIQTDDEYQRLEEIFNKLITRGEDNLSPEEARLFALLANLLEDYEKRTLPPLPKSSPIETLRFLMDENDLVQTDLEDIFGDQSTVSKVLNGKRKISKSAAVKLAARFNLSTDIFLEWK